MFTTQLSHNAVYVQVLLLCAPSVNAKQHLQHIVELAQIDSKVLLEGCIVFADAAKRLALHHNKFIIAAVHGQECLLEVLWVIFRSNTLVFLHPLYGIEHTAFEHHQCKEGHHIVRKVALLDACRSHQVCYLPYPALVVHNVTRLLFYVFLFGHILSFY